MLYDSSYAGMKGKFNERDLYPLFLHWVGNYSGLITPRPTGDHRCPLSFLSGQPKNEAAQSRALNIYLWPHDFYTFPEVIFPGSHKVRSPWAGSNEVTSLQLWSSIKVTVLTDCFETFYIYWAFQGLQRVCPAFSISCPVVTSQGDLPY